MPTAVFFRRAALAATLYAAALAPAHALLIQLSFAVPQVQRSIIAPTGRFESAGSLSGGGSFEQVFEAAADIWESLLHDDRTVAITVGWATMGFDIFAAASPGFGSFDNEIVVNRRIRAFADPTPFDNEEFTGFSSFSADLGGGSLNVGRGYGSFASPGFDVDLLSTALHEIGHLLGNPFDHGIVNGSLAVSSGPYAGTRLPCANDGGLCGHLGFGLPGALMNPSGGLPLFQRTLISDADLLFVATDGRFTDISLAEVGPQRVPEPAAPVLVTSALLALAALRWRRR